MPIDPHAIQEIDFTNLDDVRIESISEGLYCGRRFQINEGADYVIFNDLYRKARKLSRQADNPDKLAQVKAFIGKLRTVEGTANEAYEKQECGYKFISWFHRLFGGAFFDSHLERLDVLEGKVDVAALRATLKQKISIDELPILKSCMKHESITLPWKQGTVTISYNSENDEIVFTTSENKKLCIELHNDFDLKGEVTEFKEISEIIDGIYASPAYVVSATLKQKISIDKLPLLKSCMEHESITLPWKQGAVTINYNSENDEIVFTTSENKKLCIELHNDFALKGEVTEFKEISEIIDGIYASPAYIATRVTYNFRDPIIVELRVLQENSVELRVVQEEIKQIPIWHLHQFSQNMSSLKELSVTFLDSSLMKKEGLDAGGLSREFVTTLIEEVKKLTSYFCLDNGNLALPQVNGSMTAEVKQVYFDLGRTFRICYNSSDFVSGCYFNHALFNAAKILTKDQLELPFDSVPKATRGKMAQEVIKEMDKVLSTSNTMLFSVLDLLDPARLQAALDREEDILYNAIAAAELEYFTEDLTGVDFDKIRANQTQFIDELFGNIMNNPHLVAELKGASLNSILEPIHCIAQGLGENNWDQLRTDPDLIPKIQGLMDRNTIANAIEKDDSDWPLVPDEKVNWLKDWIKNEASEDEVRGFLKYVTGASSLQVGKGISITSGILPYPVAHTCDNELKISPNVGPQYPDGTKEGFIENLKGAMSVTGFQMG